MLNNSSHNSQNEKEESNEEEEVDYYINTISNSKESLNNSETSEKTDDIENMSVKNQKNNYSKDKYIKSLEQKIKEQKKQIAKLIAFKNKYEEKIKHINPLTSFSNKEKNKYNNLNNDISFNNRSNSNRHNMSFNPSKIKVLKKERIPLRLNKANSELDIMRYISSSDEDKYDKLYSKYLKIINDYKNLSNNSVSTNEYSRLKSQYNDLKNKNNNLLKEIQYERIKRDGIGESKIIKDLKEQVETFRKELVLSQALVNSLRAELGQMNKIRENDKEIGPDYINNMNNINDNVNDNTNDNIKYVDTDDNRKINFKYNNDQNDSGDEILYNNNDILKKENEDLKLSLKNKNLLLSKVLEENNRLKEKNLNNQNRNNINNMNKMNDFEDEINDLKNKLNQYEDKFDYFNDYINNIKLQIKNIFNDLLSIIYKYDSPYINKKYADEFKNKLKDLRNKIENIKGIDRFNLDSTDDEKCLQTYMNLVKILLNELENKQKINNIANNNIIKMRNDNQNNKNDLTIRQLTELIEVIKKIINDNGTKQLISDAVNIINNLSNLYKLRYSNDPVENGKNDKKIRELENELEYIKKLLINQKNNNKNNNLTYEMNYNNSNDIGSKLDNELEKNRDNNYDTIENKLENGKFKENGYYFDYD